MNPSDNHPKEITLEKTPAPGTEEAGACNGADELLPATTDCGDNDFFRHVNIDFLVHELKDPISVIETGARMLLEKNGPDAPLTHAQERTLKRILRNTCKTRDMLAELLEVGRAQSICFVHRPFKPYDVVRSILIEAIESSDPELSDQMLKMSGSPAERLSYLARNGIRLDASAVFADMSIDNDETKFSCIVSNLIKNALSYRRRHVLIHLAVERGFIFLSVRDDGPGIDPVHHEAIFQRYRQVTPSIGLARGGHGLGLAVARILARSLGGDIVVESELGLGALFRFGMPAAGDSSG